MNTPTDFPNKVDLAIKLPKAPSATLMIGGKQGKTPKAVYPSLYIDDAEGMDGMPKEGYALIYYKRRRHTMSEGDGGTHHSADLEIQEIAFPDQSADDETKDMGSALASLAQEKGIDTGMENEEEAGEDAEEEATETPEEETTEEDEEEE